MMQHTRIRSYPDSLSGIHQSPCRDDVRREAQHRLHASGYIKYKARALATGADIPFAIHHFAEELNLVAERLSALRPIPDDFQSDSHWPTLDSAH
jgi:hypothetical protein